MKKVTIILIVIIVALFGAVATYGQVTLDEKTIGITFETCHLAFEGKVVDTKTMVIPEKDKDAGAIYMLYLIQPTAVFKGQTDPTKRYEILVEWGSYVGSFKQKCGPPACAYVPDNGIFFLGKEITQPNYCISFSNAIDRWYSLAIDYKTNSREEVFKFFDEKYNLKPTILVAPMEKKSPNDGMVNPKYNGQGYYINYDTLNSVRRSKHIANDNISFEFNNFYQTGIGPFYFEFDIMAIGADTLTFFDHNNSFAFNYSLAAFGDSIVSNHHVTVTKGLAYNDTTYYDPNPLASDYNANTIVVPFGVDLSLSTWNRTRVETVPVPILHFKIEVQDCSQPVNIFFNGAPLGISYYTHNADDYPTLDTAYNSGYLNNIGGLYCVNVPYIDNFTHVVYPGSYFKGNFVNKAKMEIYGNNFGNVKGNGTVYFKNADDGGASFIRLNDYDIPDSNWTNTKITITVPSIIDSFYLPSTPCPGSGIFYVQTNTLQKAWSTNIADSIVLFPYAIRNEILTPNVNIPTYRKLRDDIANTDVQGGYTFHLDPSVILIPNSALLIPCIVESAADWRCATSMPYDSLGTSFNCSGFNTLIGISTIFAVDSFPGYPTALAGTVPHFAICYTAMDTLPFCVDIKIGFVKDPSLIPQLGGRKWFFDPSTFLISDSVPTNKEDFLIVMRHEMGHGDLEEHVNQIQDLMFYSQPPGPTPNFLRVNISQADTLGGQNIVAKSASDLASGCTLFIDGPAIPAHCSNPAFITEINSNVLSFKAYPNPVSNDLLNIEYELKQDAPVNFIILDNMGKEVYKINENQTSGKHIDKMNLQSLAAGLYYLEVIINDKGDTQPIIKIR